MPRILLIEDEPDVRHVATECLATGDFCIDAPAVEDADISRATVEAAGAGQYDLIILDLRLPHLDPFELIEAVKSSKDGPPIMVLAGFLSIEIESRLRGLGVQTFTTKPFTFSDLLSSVDECLAAGAAVEKIP